MNKQEYDQLKEFAEVQLDGISGDELIRLIDKLYGKQRQIPALFRKPFGRTSAGHSDDASTPTGIGGDFSPASVGSGFGYKNCLPIAPSSERRQPECHDGVQSSEL